MSVFDKELLIKTAVTGLLRIVDVVASAVSYLLKNLNQEDL